MHRSTLNFKMVAKVIGALVIIEATFMLLSAFVSFWYEETDFNDWLLSLLLTATVGLVLLATGKNADKRIGRRESYLIVATVWIVLSLLGMLPYMMSGAIPRFEDAFFETISGFTTTGATVLTDIEAQPHSILFWRSLTQWLGGMGIIALSLAILPMFGLGSMQLYSAEATGPTHEKLRPHIEDTAKILWGLYVILTLVEFVLLMMCGMNAFDACCHAFSTISTGGYSTKNDSVAAFHSPAVEYVIIIFMFLSGINYSLLYWAVRGKISHLLHDEEARFYIGAIVLFSLLIAIGLMVQSITAGQGWQIESSLRRATFQVVSCMTTTGFITDNYLNWPLIVIIFFLAALPSGGSAGSTSGGIKWIRIVILLKNIHCEFRRLIHPNALIKIRLNQRLLPNSVVNKVFAFLMVYVFLTGAGILLISGLGVNLSEAIGASITSIGNIGPSFGALSGASGNYAAFPPLAKVGMSLLMLIGRLELFTIIIVFTPTFWRK